MIVKGGNKLNNIKFTAEYGALKEFILFGIQVIEMDCDVLY